MIKTCRVCSNGFRVKPCHAPKRHTCSYACMASEYSQRMRGDSNPNYRGVEKRACLKCGLEYSSYDKRRKYCSAACYHEVPKDPSRQRAISLLPRKKRIKLGSRCTCKQCGLIFRHQGKRVLCIGCRDVRNIRRCFMCKGLFRFRVAKKTCSELCQRKWRAYIQRGSKSHRWQGGKTNPTILFRSSVEYAIWREAVFERDQFCCVMCGQRGQKLAAHHIREFSKYPDLRLVIANGVALCWPCHRSIKGKESKMAPVFDGHVAKATTFEECLRIIGVKVAAQGA